MKRGKTIPRSYIGKKVEIDIDGEKPRTGWLMNINAAWVTLQMATTGRIVIVSRADIKCVALVSRKPLKKGMLV